MGGCLRETTHAVTANAAPHGESVYEKPGVGPLRPRPQLHEPIKPQNASNPKIRTSGAPHVSFGVSLIFLARAPTGIHTSRW